MILSQTTDLAGKIRIVWQSSASGEVYHFKFSDEPTQQQLETLSNRLDAERDTRKTESLTFNIFDHFQLIVTFLQAVKERPNLTLNQYNTYLNALAWYDAAVIRFFVFVFAAKLAERRDVSLQNQTEATVLQAVRNFIVDTPPKKLAKLIFNQNTGE